jgi:hypothetical protein
MKCEYAQTFGPRLKFEGLNPFILLTPHLTLWPKATTSHLKRVILGKYCSVLTPHTLILHP